MNTLLLGLSALSIIYVICVALKYTPWFCLKLVLALAWLTIVYRHSGETAVVVAALIIPVLSSATQSVLRRLTGLRFTFRSDREVRLCHVQAEHNTDLVVSSIEGEWLPKSPELEQKPPVQDGLKALNTWL